MKFSKTGLILGLSYLGIFFTGGLLVEYYMASSKLSETGWYSAAFIAVLVTAPTSLILWGVFDLLEYLPWYKQISDPIIFYSIFIFSALLNAAFLYLVGRLFDNVVKQVNTESETDTGVALANIGRLWKKFNLFFWTYLSLLIVLSFLYNFFMSLKFQQISLVPQQIESDDYALLYYRLTIFVFALRIAVSIIAGVFLSYFGYLITQQKRFLLFLLLIPFGLIPKFGAAICFVGCIIGYIILFQAKKNLTRSSF